MGFDGSGNYTRTNGTQTGTTLWQDRAAIAPATISASEHDAEMNDVANALTACLKADGSKTATNNQPMGGFKHTSVANATLANEYATLGQVQTGLTVNDLVVNANSTTTALRVTQVGTGEAFRVEDSANPDSTPFVVTATGNVGIGRSNPTGLLHIYSQTSTQAQALVQGLTTASGGSGKASINIDVDGNGGWLVENNASGGTRAFTISENSGYGVSTLERLRITSGGNVGIGTNNPSDILTVVGKVSLGNDFAEPASASERGYLNLLVNDANSDILFVDRGNGATRLGINTSDSRNFTHVTDTAFVWRTGGTSYSGFATGTERMRITSGGNVGIGTNNPTYQLQLSTDSAAKATTNTWTIASDERIKTNIQDYTKGLDEIKQVRPITYDYNGLGGNPAGLGGISIVAQELQSIFPECVGTFSAKLNPDDEQETELLNYNGHAITFALINAIKELATKVETLEAEIATLKGA